MNKTFIVILFLNTYIFAQSQLSEKIDLNEATKIPDNMKLKQLHEFEGCPDNSQCTREQGQMYLQFKKVIQEKNMTKINAFISQNGALVTGWSKTDQFQNNPITIYDSKCKDHRTKDHKVYEAEVFSKKTPTGFIHQYAYTKFDNKIIKIAIPRRSIPVVIDNQHFVALMDYEGLYYNLLINSQKEFTINFKKYPEKEILQVSCSAELVDFLKNEKDMDIYSSYYCKKIWNLEKQDFQEILLSWSC